MVAQFRVVSGLDFIIIVIVIIIMSNFLVVLGCSDDDSVYSRCQYKVSVPLKKKRPTAYQCF